MTVLIREKEHEPYKLATYLQTAKDAPWSAIKEAAVIFILFALMLVALFFEVTP